VSGAQVAAHGAGERAGATSADGTITLQNMPAGTYRCRISRDGFITLEKEVTVKAAARGTAEASLSVAPATPAPTPTPMPTPVEKPSAPMGPPGELKMMNIAAIGDQMYQTLKDTSPTADRALGCSGVLSSMIVASRDNIAAHRHADADEIIYVMGGDATLTINDKEQVITAGWFGLVPRGASHTVASRGR